MKEKTSCHQESADTGDGKETDNSLADDRSVIQPNKDALIKRMNRITGQVQGVTRMLLEDRYCVDILTQISAAKSALDAVAMQLLEDHTHHCVRNSIRSGEGEKEIAELMEIFKKYIKT